METSAAPESVPFKPYSWYVGIPICTNPLIILDVITVAAILWAGGMLFVMLGQATIGGGLTYDAVMASFFIGMYLALAALAAFVFVGGFLFGNRYAALYRIDAHGIYCEYMRGDIHAIGRIFLPGRGYAVSPVRDPHKTVEKRIQWESIRSIGVMEKQRVLVIRGRRGTLAKVYCPDAAVLQKAERMIRDALPQ